MLVLLALGCDLLPEAIPQTCPVRSAWYPDADGDGLGEPTDVYVGCDAPPGWVASLAPPSTGDTGGAAATAETGGATADTGAGSPDSADTAGAP